MNLLCWAESACWTYNSMTEGHNKHSALALLASLMDGLCKIFCTGKQENHQKIIAAGIETVCANNKFLCLKRKKRHKSTSSNSCIFARHSNHNKLHQQFTLMASLWVLFICKLRLLANQHQSKLYCSDYQIVINISWRQIDGSVVPITLWLPQAPASSSRRWWAFFITLSVTVFNADEQRDASCLLGLFAQNTECFSTKRTNWWNTNVTRSETKTKTWPWLSTFAFLDAFRQLHGCEVNECNCCKINLSALPPCEVKVPSAAVELQNSCPVTLIVTPMEIWLSWWTYFTWLDRSECGGTEGTGLSSVLILRHCSRLCDLHLPYTLQKQSSPVNNHV